MTGDGGERRGERGLHGPGADLAVQRVQPGCLDADADLPGAGLRDLDVRLVQHFGASETVEQDGFHDDSSRAATHLGGWTHNQGNSKYVASQVLAAGAA
jgi:hypothetical protein